MHYEEIEVFISAAGEVELQVRGIKGDQCESITDEFIQSLGGEVVEHERTMEFYEEQTETVLDQHRIGDY